jgi:L-2,4-diaminobutyrate decarboxylase
MNDPDFAANAEELERAVAQLIAAHGAEAEPHPGSAELDLPAELPEEGVGGAEALHVLGERFLGGAARLGHPGYLAHMDPPTPWMTWAAALWSAAFNQNLLHTDTAPLARELERHVVDWLAPPFVMDGGHLVPGSTVANLTALWAAREIKGVRTVVASELAHLSVRKAARILGLEMREVAAGEDHRMVVGGESERTAGGPRAGADIAKTGGAPSAGDGSEDAAGAARADDRSEPPPDLDLRTTAVVMTAGTVAAGAIDPLDAFPGAAWRHVDAAWGGPLRLTRHAALLDGIERADSVSFSAHKWLFQPKESGVVLFKDAERAHAALSFGGGYLAVPNVGLLGSHGATALPLAATILAWGREGIAARVERCMELAGALAERIRDEPTLELFAPPTTGVVLWRPLHADVRETRTRMRGAFVSLADVKGETWLRSVAANPHADPGRVVDSVLAAV